MSQDFTFVDGVYHIAIRLWGSPEKINLFHDIMMRCDGDWPWRSSCISGPVCDTCMGAILRNPRVAPSDIKAAGRQAGVKVKIYGCMEESHCLNDHGWAPRSYVKKENMYKLCEHKPSRMIVTAGDVAIITASKSTTNQATSDSLGNGEDVVVDSSYMGIAFPYVN